MSVYKKVSALSEEKFRRLTGIKKSTFDLMVKILRKANQERERKGGRKRKLSIEDIVLMTMEHLREYRTLLQMSVSWGISQSQAHRTCRWTEDVLMQDKRFRLPSKKALPGSNTEISVIMIDATESPIQRPKKTKESTTQERKNDTRKKPK